MDSFQEMIKHHCNKSLKNLKEAHQQNHDTVEDISR